MNENTLPLVKHVTTCYSVTGSGTKEHFNLSMIIFFPSMMHLVIAANRNISPLYSSELTCKLKGKIYQIEIHKSKLVKPKRFLGMSKF